MKLKQKVAIIGVGKMGNTLIDSMLKNKVVNTNQLYGTTSRLETAEQTREKYHINVNTDNLSAVRESDIIILTVKPQIIPRILKEINEVLDKEKLVISIAAAITTHFMEEQLDKDISIIRAMPNVASLVNEGMTVL